MNIVYDQLLEPEKNSLVTSVDSLGHFQIDVPLLNPQRIMLAFGDKTIAFYAIPGSRLILYIEANKVYQVADGSDLLFAGSSANLNAEIHAFKSKLSQISLQSTKINLDDIAYKDFRLEKMNEQLQAMNTFAQKQHFSQRFIQQMTMHIRYSAGADLLRYRLYHNGEDSLSPKYLSFLKEIPLCNDTAVLTTAYPEFLREYLLMKREAMERQTPAFNISLADMLEKMGKGENRIPPEAKKLLIHFAELQQKKDTAATAVFWKRDSLALKKYFKEYQGVFKEYAQKIIDEKQSDMEKGFRKNMASISNNKFGENIILAMLAFDEINTSHPLDEEAMAFYKSNINSAVLYHEVYNKNKAVAEKLAGKMPEGAEVVPPLKAAKDSVFAALIAPYKGKVVYVDFWAPWCGPCMSEMPASRSLQKEMEQKDVVFLFLGVNCSATSWKNTIKTKQLGGQHYLLSNNEFALLSSKFHFRGIPHYVLVDKNGKITNPDAATPDNYLAVEEIEELLK